MLMVMLMMMLMMMLMVTMMSDFDDVDHHRHSINLRSIRRTLEAVNRMKMMSSMIMIIIMSTNRRIFMVACSKLLIFHLDNLLAHIIATILKPKSLQLPASHQKSCPGCSAAAIIVTFSITLVSVICRGTWHPHP